ncbi:MAG: tyrosine-protein phosphatase [Clostridiales bacterium]|nr:tyrosine-protein phosphatase [Clostridiales bacterium]
MGSEMEMNMNGNIIELPGIRNTRELGGYPVSGGRVIRKGLLIRGGAISGAQPESIDILVNKYHVQTIIDLRMDHTIDGHPDPEVPGAENIRLPVVEIQDYLARTGRPELLEQFMSFNLEDPQDKSALFDIAVGYGFFSPEIYDLFLLGDRGRRAYSAFFRILLGSDPAKGAIFWHCVGGKDRAGLASMLLLTALGADRDVIIEDYLMTNICNAEKIEKTRKMCEAANMPKDKIESRLFVASCVYERYMTHAMGTLENEFGSVTGYLHDGLGLTDEDIILLQEKYTEKVI